MLYAFDSSSNSSTPVWSRDLAAAVGGTAVSCSLFPNWPLCLNKPSGQHIVGPTIGVTGTPVIDTSASPKTLYVAEAADVSGTIRYYLLAVDITTGNVLGTGIQIAGSVPGLAPSKCGTSSPLTGQTIKFDNNHIQRSGLLLLNGKVYVAFAAGPGDEVENGWLFAYSFTSNTFSQTAAFSTTPDGTGGGIWMSGAGPASDGNSIFVTTGNGTFDLNGSSPLDDDAGDSLLKLTPALVRSDYYTPSDVFSYNNNQGRCVNDIDFGSGGVLLPTNFTYTGSNGGCSSGCGVAVNADKESKLYVANTANLGGFDGTKDCSSNFNNIQCVATPAVPSNDPLQGYWASPAYWTYTSGSTTKYMLYYAATMQSTTAGVAPEAINAYQLQTSGSPGPIPSATPFASTSTLFCDFSPTPSVSSNSTQAATGILWAIETSQNSNNNGVHSPPDCYPGLNYQNVVPHAALHAFCAAAGTPSGPCPTALTEIYSSRNLQHTEPSLAHAFPTPTISNGYVYIGTDAEVDVFGLCINGVKGACVKP